MVLVAEMGVDSFSDVIHSVRVRGQFPYLSVTGWSEPPDQLSSLAVRAILSRIQETGKCIGGLIVGSFHQLWLPSVNCSQILLCHFTDIPYVINHILQIRSSEDQEQEQGLG